MPKPSSEVIHLDPSLEKRLLSSLQPEDKTESLFNLVRAALAAHEHAFHFPHVTKEDFLSFMDQAWEAGEHQRRICSGEIGDGKYNTEFGVALNVAAFVALSSKLHTKEKIS